MKLNWKIVFLCALLSLPVLYANGDDHMVLAEQNGEEPYMLLSQEQPIEPATNSAVFIIILALPLVISAFIYGRRKRQKQSVKESTEATVPEGRSVDHITAVLDIVLITLLILFAWNGYLLFSKQPLEVTIVQTTAPEEHTPATMEAHADQEAMDHDMAMKSESTIYFERPKEIWVGEQAKLMFQVRDKDGNSVANLHKHHARLFHVVIISEDMNVIGHIHPEDFQEYVEGKLVVYFTFPKAGRYIIGGDAMDANGAISRQFIVTVDGNSTMEAVQEDFSRTKSFTSYPLEESDRYTGAVVMEESKGEYEVTLTAPEKIQAGKTATLAYAFQHNNEDVQDFVPFLDAPLHAAVVNVELDTFIHEHGEVTGSTHDNLPENFGPNFELVTVFPNPGVYAVFTQTKHQQKMVVTKFMVEVQP